MSQSKFVQRIPYYRLITVFMRTEGNLPGCANWLLEPYLLSVVSCLLEVNITFFILL